MLQYQSFMFSKAFAQMIGSTASGNPAIIADPITWSARLIGDHVVVTNAVFATIQLLIGLGIAWRPTVRIALGASVIWALGVWWFGEGLGPCPDGRREPAQRGPGAVIIYALLAVLLWPVARDRPAPFVAGRAVGIHAARAAWLVLWASLAYFALTPGSRAPQAVSSTISGMASGQPGWLAWIDNHAASALSHDGLAVPIVLAIALIVVALGVFLPPPAARATLVLALVLAAAIWLAEGLGGILTGSGTDPNSGPLLALLAIAYWPVAKAVSGKRRCQPRHRRENSDMTGPSWLGKLLAAVMIVTAAYCFSRLVVAWRSKRRTDYDVDGVHIVMGVAMAGMLVPRLNPFWDSGWEVIFAAAVAWFGWQTIRGIATSWRSAAVGSPTTCSTWWPAARCCTCSWR